MASSKIFANGQKVLCCQGPLIYEAKCLKSEITEKQTKYFVHYLGWNKKWDEWVTDTRVLEYNETNLQKKKELDETHKEIKKSRAASKVLIKTEKTEKMIVQKAVPEKAAKTEPAQKTVPEKTRAKPVQRTLPIRAARTKPLEKTVPVKTTRTKPVEKAVRVKTTRTEPVEKAVPVKTTRTKPAEKTVPEKTAKSKPVIQKRVLPDRIAKHKVSGPTPQQIAEIKAEVAFISSSLSSKGTDKISSQPQPMKKDVSNERCFAEESKMEVEIKLIIPNLLKDWLVEDLFQITQQRMVLSLPARITVDDVITAFIREKLSNDAISQSEKETAIEIAEKLKDIFNGLLSKILLSRFEREQYAQKLAEYRDRNLCQIYGIIHLLRMFNDNLEDLLKDVGATGDIGTLFEHLNDILQYISMNENFFSRNDYIVKSPKYCRGRKFG